MDPGWYHLFVYHISGEKGSFIEKERGRMTISSLIHYFIIITRFFNEPIIFTNSVFIGVEAWNYSILMVMEELF